MVPFVKGEVTPLSVVGDEGRSLRADAQRNRQAILAAAETEFRARGADASMDGIAERAGVGVGTIYRNYPTKDALMRAIVSARIQPLLRSARQALTEENARAAFTGFVRELMSGSCDFKALADALDDAGFDMAAAKEDVGGELFSLIRRLFERAQGAGAIRADVTMDDMRVLIMGMSHTAQASGDPEQVARCVDLLCHAICAPDLNASTAPLAGGGYAPASPRL